MIHQKAGERREKMKYMRQFGIIMIVTCVGEVIKNFVPLPIPSSVYGLILMMILLMTKIVKLDSVKETGIFLIEIMPMMFIPAAVGLVDAWSELKAIFLPTICITIISTILVMIVSGWVTQKIRARSMDK